ncbi:MAG TPA: ATP synthase F1 subunit gamma [Bacilli bacterium]|nr:ATP synthase F1 subunit gamma [Bacilli bacterium]
MPKGLPVLKRRINSIKATKKVTKAMEMIATTRLKVWKDIMGQTRLYTEALLAVVRHHLVTKDTKELPLFSENDAPVSLHVVITSSLGLCGSYNYNIYQYIDKNIPLEDEIVIIGEKGLRHYRRSNRRLKTGHVQLGKMNEADIRHLSKFIIESFKEKQYRNVNVVYTRFINSLQAEPTSLTLLPLAPHDNNDQMGYGPLIEPSAIEVIEALLPFYLNNVLFATLTESMVSEQSARRTAMEKASDNADDLIEELELVYNKMRQAAITQEIAEIIGGSGQ